MSASPVAVATVLLSALEPDKFYSPDNAARRFRLAGLGAAQQGVLSAARAAGWVVDYPDRNELVIPAFCWLPTGRAPQFTHFIAGNND